MRRAREGPTHRVYVLTTSQLWGFILAWGGMFVFISQFFPPRTTIAGFFLPLLGVAAVGVYLVFRSPIETIERKTTNLPRRTDEQTN